MKNGLSCNHGAMVAKPGEPTLQSLVKQLVKEEKDTSKQIQILLDFVTNEINFNYREMYATYEVLKRPNEVLLTRSSDCSGKSILFASLLEQIGADYHFAYLKDHLCVIVNGTFPSDSVHTYQVNKKSYQLAETTLPGFKIGVTQLEQPMFWHKILFTQKPSRDSKILKYPTGEVARLFSREKAYATFRNMR
jgi:hypothetical protein